MTIYLDYLIIDNISFDCLLLWLACKTAKRKVVWWRLLLGGFLGVLCAFVSIFCQGALLVFVKVSFVLPMCLVVSGKRKLWVVALLFVAYTFLLGGTIFGLFGLFNVDFEWQGNLNYYMSIPLGIYFAGVLVVLMLSQWLTRYLTAQKRVLSKVVQATINLANQTINLDALCDSGNLLVHNNLPVCFAVGDFSSKFAQIVAEQLLVGKVETICYNTVSGSAQSLAIKCQLTLGQTSRDCYVALSKVSGSVDYQLILNGDFCDESFSNTQSTL